MISGSSHAFRCSERLVRSLSTTRSLLSSPTVCFSTSCLQNRPSSLSLFTPHQEEAHRRQKQQQYSSQSRVFKDESSSAIFGGLIVVGVLSAFSALQEEECQAAEQVQTSQVFIQDFYTGLQFPVFLELPGIPKQKLVTTGERTVFWVSTYAMGFYVAATDPLSFVQAFQGVEETGSGEKEAFFKLLKESQYPKTLRLVSARTTTGDHFRSSFELALRPKLTHLDQTQKVELLNRFNGAIPHNLPVGTAIEFCWTSPRVLTICVNGQTVEVIEDGRLCCALFELYLGEESKTPALKMNLIKTLSALSKQNPSSTQN